MGRIGTENAKAILRDHKNLICSHVDSIKLGTLGSFVAVLGDKTAWIADGHPLRQNIGSSGCKIIVSFKAKN